MALLEELKVLIVGNATGAIAAFRETGSASDALTSKQTTLGKVTQKLGLQGLESGALLKAGMVGGAAAAGVAITKFALDGVSRFADLTAQTRSLRNVMGGTAEDASRIAGASRDLGLDVDTVSKGFFQLTKRIADNKDTLAENGVQVERNANGSVDMAKTLVNVSEGYKAITDPAERNLFLMQNFGKAGANLIPLLAQGKDKLAEFYAQTAKHGEVFSEADLEKGRQYKIAMNELDQAWQGLSSTLGREVIPLVTQFARGLDVIVTAAPDAASAVTDFFTSWISQGSKDQFVRGLDAIGDALGLAGDEAKVAGAGFSDLQQRFAGLDASKAATSFLQMGVEAAKTGNSVGAAKQQLLDFILLAQQDVGAAAQVIEGLKARGANTDVYEQALKRVASQQYDNIVADQKQKDAMVLLTGSYEDQLKIIDKTNDALLAQYDKGFAAIHAQEGLKDATYNLVEARQKDAEAGLAQGEQSDATTRAFFSLEEAALKAGDAARQKAEADNQGLGAAAAAQAGVDAQKQALNEFAQTLAPDDPLRVFLQQYIDKLNDPAINSVHTATLEIPGLDDIIAKLNYTRDTLNDLTSNEHRIAVALQGDPIAGIIGFVPS